VAAPPLTNPLGHLLFDEPVAAVRVQVASDEGLSQAALLAAWRETRRLRAVYAGRHESLDAPEPR
jgi:hypothetical protein